MSLTLDPIAPVVRQFFTTTDLAREQQALIWRQRQMVGCDIPVTHADIAHGFHATVERFHVGGMKLFHTRSDATTQKRSITHISRDNIRDYVFWVQLEGMAETTVGLYPKRQVTLTAPCMMLLDMNQPAQTERRAGRVMTLFVPRALMEASLPQAEALHGRVMHFDSPLARLIPVELAMLRRHLATMNMGAAYQSLCTCVELLTSAFGKQHLLTGNTHFAMRAAQFSQVRAYISDNLDNPALSLDSVLAMSPLSRTVLYRLFEHEGGLAAYIRNRRLRAAAEEIIAFPERPISEVAYGFGFKSVVSFNQAFLRGHGVSPRELRKTIAER